MNVGLVGTGYWGQNYINIITEKFPNIKLKTCTYNYKEIINDNTINSIIIATPSDTHYQIAKEALLAGKHVLVEKPFTTNIKHAKELVKLAKKHSLILTIGHIFLFHKGINKIKKIIENNELGIIESVFIKRLNQSKYSNALWELGSHDIYILNYLFNDYKYKVNAAMGTIEHCIFNIDFYKNTNRINTYTEVNSDNSEKIKSIIINGSDKKLEFDDNPNPIIIITNKITNTRIYHHIEDSMSTLEKQCINFFECVLNLKSSFITPLDGLQNIKILNKINKFL